MKDLPFYGMEQDMKYIYSKEKLLSKGSENKKKTALLHFSTFISALYLYISNHELPGSCLRRMLVLPCIVQPPLEKTSGYQLSHTITCIPAKAPMWKQMDYNALSCDKRQDDCVYGYWIWAHRFLINDFWDYTRNWSSKNQIVSHFLMVYYNFRVL